MIMMKIKHISEAASMMFKFYNINFEKTNIVYNKCKMRGSSSVSSSNRKCYDRIFRCQEFWSRKMGGGVRSGNGW